MIIKHANQPGKSVLLFSGPWSSFTTACADTLAQDVLKSSPLSVFALRTCHPLQPRQRLRAQPPSYRWPLWCLLLRPFFHPCSRRSRRRNPCWGHQLQPVPHHRLLWRSSTVPTPPPHLTATCFTLSTPSS